jgi:glucan phosphoethanolaminetransferase (alkaline phosphatase superfamily)
MYELIGTTFLLLLSFIFFIGTLNIVILIVSKNEKYAIMVIIILLLSAFIPSRSESNIIFYLPGSWGMVLRTKELNHNGINEYLAIILNILFAFISMTVGKIIYKKRM